MRGSAGERLTHKQMTKPDPPDPDGAQAYPACALRGDCYINRLYSYPLDPPLMWSFAVPPPDSGTLAVSRVPAPQPQGIWIKKIKAEKWILCLYFPNAALYPRSVQGWFAQWRRSTASSALWGNPASLCNVRHIQRGIWPHERRIMPAVRAFQGNG